MVIRLRIIAAVIAACAASSSASAQSTSLFGNSGPRANSSTAGSTSSGRQSSGGGMQSASGAAGARSGGGGAAAGSGSSDAFQGPQLGETGDLSAQSVGRTGGFVGGASGGMVGDRLAGTTGATATQRPNFGALGSGGGSDFNSQNRPQQGASSTRNFRPRYRVGFEYTPSASDVSVRTAATIGRLTSRNPALSGLEIVVDDAGMAEVRGTAPTAAARKLIENVVRLEPGVRQVTNLVVIAPPAPENP